MRGRDADRGLKGVREMAKKKGNYRHGMYGTPTYKRRKYGISRSNLANKVYIYHMDITDAVDYLRGCDSNR